ncbi:MAG: sensor histidine kinase [Desulfotomaculales bacterium]
MLKLRSITTKIFLGYAAAVICSTGVMGFLFHTLTRHYMEAQVARAMMRQAQTLAREMSREHAPPARVPIPFGDQVLEGDFVVTDREGTVLYGSAPAAFPPGIRLPHVLREAMPPPPAALPRGHRDYIVAATPLPSGEQPGGTMYLLLRRGAFDALNARLFRIFLQSLGAGLAVSLIGAWLVARHLTRPLHALKEKARAIARREFDARVEVGSQDELADLARTFNEMAAALKEHEAATKRFLQHTSHELRTPLTSIQGYAEGIKDGVFTGEDAEHAADIIARETGRLCRFVDELLYLARLESPHETYALEPVDACEMLAAAVEGLGGYATERGVALVNEVKEEIPLQADAAKLRRLFDNLLGNAIRHAAGRVVVTAQKQETGGVTIAFRDDGPGFDAQHLDRVFEPYFRGRRGNTGLGLAIVRTIAEKHGGSVRAANEPHGGAVVEVTLPPTCSPESRG